MLPEVEKFEKFRQKEDLLLLKYFFDRMIYIRNVNLRD